MNKKNEVIIILCVVLFGIIGIYLTFFSSNTSKYDSKTKAYKIEIQESNDSDNNKVYYPIYYFKVEGKRYTCTTKTGSSIAPNRNKNIVYYDSKNPEKCITQYEKTSSRIGGIICLGVSLLVLFLGFRKPKENLKKSISEPIINKEQEAQITKNAENIEVAIEKLQLIIKRIILGIILFFLFLFNLFDMMILKQTIESKDYIDATATYEDQKENSKSENLKDYIYTFQDRKGKKQEIIVSYFQDEEVKNKIKIKYNEKKPQEYYQEGQIFDKKGIFWYSIRIIMMILLIMLFFNKKLLSKINIFVSKN